MTRDWRHRHDRGGFSTTMTFLRPRGTLPLATVRLPAGSTFLPFDIGADYVVGVHRDRETHVETVRLYTITR